VPQAGCGACEQCRRGRPIFCTHCKFLTGGFADAIAIPYRSAVLLPQSLSFADAALVEPMACGLRALRLAGMRGGERVMVLGGGSMAIALIYWARALGAAAIVAVSRSSHRRDTLMALGADAVLAFGEIDESDPRALTRALGGPPDIVAECIGKPGMLAEAIAQAAPGAAVICMGMCMQPEPVTPALCAFKETRLYFPVAYSIDEFVETAETFNKGSVNPELMISDVIGLDALPTMFEKLRAGARTLKVHVDPTLEPADA
jgi:threonine dehydrogenase-like Zn-dependent dehydrogenase